MTADRIPSTWYYVPAPHANRGNDYVPVVVILEHGTKLVFSDLSVADTTDTSNGSYHRTESEAYRALVANLRLEVEHAAQALRDAEQRLIDVLDKALLVDRNEKTPAVLTALPMHPKSTDVTSNRAPHKDAKERQTTEFSAADFAKLINDAARATEIFGEDELERFTQENHSHE